MSVVGDLTISTHKKKRAPKHWRSLFLASLAEHGIVSHACDAACVTKRTVYDARSADPEFAAAWEDALEVATDVMIAEARRRSVKGVEESIFYQGEECGRVRRYSDVLLMFLIKKERPAYRDGRPDERRGDDGQRQRIGVPDSDGRYESEDPGGRPPEAGDPVPDTT